MIDVRITKRDPRAVLPAYQTAGAAGFDLAILDDAVIAPRAHVLLRTGLGIGVPDDHVFHVYARSSLFPKHGLIVANGVGVIDPDYSGPDDEVLISVWNPGDREVRIAAGTRVAQGIIFPRPRIRWIEADASGGTRGGFGSTGR